MSEIVRGLAQVRALIDRAQYTDSQDLRDRSLDEARKLVTELQQEQSHQRAPHAHS